MALSHSLINLNLRVIYLSNKIETKTYVFNSDEYEAIIYNKLTDEIVDIPENKKDILDKIISVVQKYKSDESVDVIKKFNSDSAFTKNFAMNGHLFRILLNPSEVSVLMFISDYISCGDCVLRTSGNLRGNIITVNQLAKDYDMSVPHFRKIMSALHRKQVIIYHNANTIHDFNGKIISSRCITFNPYIIFKGQNLNSEIRDIYSKSVWASIVKDDIKVNLQK